MPDTLTAPPAAAPAAPPTAAPALFTPPAPMDDVRIASEQAEVQRAMTDRYRESMAAIKAKEAEGAGTVAVTAAAATPATPPAASQPPTEPASTTIPPPAPDDIPLHERPPESASKTTKEHWERFRVHMRQQVDAERTAKAALEKELSALKATASNGHSPELEALRQEKADLESRLERYDLENSPRFKNHYDRGIDEQYALIKEVGGAGADEIIKLLKAPRSAERNARLKELTSELGLEGDIVTSAAAKIVQLSLERSKQLDNHRENLKLLRAKEAAEASEATARDAATRARLADTIVARAGSLPEFSPAAADTEHVAFATSAKAFIRDALTGKLSADDAHLLPVAAMKAQYLEKFTIPKLTADLKSRDEQIATLTARVQALTGATPRADGSVAPAPSGSAPSGSAPDFTSDPQKAIEAMTRRYREKLNG